MQRGGALRFFLGFGLSACLGNPVAAELPHHVSEPALYREFGDSKQLAILLGHRGALDSMAKDGALGRNRRRFSDVAAQRDVLWAYRLFSAEMDFGEGERAARAFGYGFARLDAGGFFQNGHGASARKAMSADAFFLNAYVRAYALAQASEADAALDALRAFEEPAARAFAWLYDNREELARQDRKAPNRLLFDAAAFLLWGKISGEARYKEVGGHFLNAALKMQRADGVFVEHGGHDSSYQAVSLLNLVTLYPYMEDKKSRSAMGDALQRGMRWLGSRIEADGHVMVDGNTRTGRGQEKLFGKPKEVNYAEVALALALWGLAVDDESSVIAAENVVRYAASR